MGHGAKILSNPMSHSRRGPARKQASVGIGTVSRQTALVRDLPTPHQPALADLTSLGQNRHSCQTYLSGSSGDPPQPLSSSPPLSTLSTQRAYAASIGALAVVVGGVHGPLGAVGRILEGFWGSVGTPTAAAGRPPAPWLGGGRRTSQRCLRLPNATDMTCQPSGIWLYFWVSSRRLVVGPQGYAFISTKQRINCPRRGRTHLRHGLECRLTSLCVLWRSLCTSPGIPVLFWLSSTYNQAHIYCEPPLRPPAHCDPLPSCTDAAYKHDQTRARRRIPPGAVPEPAGIKGGRARRVDSDSNILELE